MGNVKIVQADSGEVRLHVDMVDSELVVVITDEGLIIDLVSDGAIEGTRCEQWDRIATDLQEKSDDQNV